MTDAVPVAAQRMPSGSLVLGRLVGIVVRLGGLVVAFAILAYIGKIEGLGDRHGHQQ